jgi:ribosomal protein S18 acetylase RimI-like enzyme
MATEIRHATRSDYGRVIQHVNAWWGGREMAPMLPKLFFLHFEGTSFVAEDGDGRLVAFLIGFVSQTDPEEAYVHFVGVAPTERGTGIGRTLYERFFAVVAERGCTCVRCVTSPLNEDSVAFHESLGFSVESVAPDYDGPGEDRVLLVKQLAAADG